MRLSATKKDYGFALLEALMLQDKHPKVFLDGVQFDDAIVADTDKGEIVTWMSHDEQNEFDEAHISDTNFPLIGERRTKTLTGVVTIEWTNGKGEPTVL